MAILSPILLAIGFNALSHRFLCLNRWQFAHRVIRFCSLSSPKWPVPRCDRCASSTDFHSIGIATHHTARSPAAAICRVWTRGVFGLAWEARDSGHCACTRKNLFSCPVGSISTSRRTARTRVPGLPSCKLPPARKSAQIISRQ